MKLSQTLLPAFTALSLALTPACAQKEPTEKPELTERDRQLCDSAIKYARLSTGAAVNHKMYYPEKVFLPPVDREQIELLEKVRRLRQDLVLSEGLLLRNCDERFDGQKPELRTCTHFSATISDCDETVSDMRKEIDTLYSEVFSMVRLRSKE